MVRGRDLRISGIVEAVRAELKAAPRFNPAELRPRPPAWLSAVEKVPPSEVLTRPIPPRFQKPNPRMRKPRKIYKPQQIVYEEDELRRTFFKEHPWELARPRQILEIDGKDSWACDWSRGLIQPGIPLSGECVVQRQLWLMRNTEGMTKSRAYDIARQEFYALRQEEQVELRIAREEAMMVGAYFGKNRLQVGQELEDAEFEKWKLWAKNSIFQRDTDRSSAYTSFGAPSEDKEVDADLEELATAEVAGQPAA